MAITLISGLKQANGGVFPLIDSNDIQGGLYSVTTAEEVELIPSARLKEGMLCWVEEDEMFQQYKNSAWGEFKAGFDVNETFAELNNKTIIQYIKANATNISNVTARVKTLEDTKFSGSYNDLTNKPSIPSKVSQLTNDAGYITAADVDTSTNHVHANKSVLDKVTDAKLTNWDAAYTHSQTSHNYAPATHDHNASQVTKMTGYAKPTTAGSIAATDSLNAAIGKLEKALDGKQASGSYASSSHNHDGVYRPISYVPSWGEVTGKPSTFAPSSHNQASSTINAMTGYEKPTTTSAIATTDTLNSAIGKLEKALDGKQASGSYAPASHTSDTTVHITSAERSKWNAKSDLALGTTSATAFRGDQGLTAYNHSQAAHAPSNAEQNVQSDWNEVNTGSDAYIKNKPTIPVVDVNKAYVDTGLAKKANTTDLHSHANKTVLDGISSTKVASWDAKSDFSGSYNDLTNKPSIPSIAGLATESYVNNKVAGIVSSAPETLDTLNELAEALGNDPNFATTVTELIGTKADSTHNHNSSYATKASEHTHSNKSVLDGISSAKVTEWNNKSTFSGSYKDLTNKPTLNDFSYTHPSYPDMATLQDALDELLYVSPSVSTFSASPTPGTYEVGSTVKAPITLNWNYNKEIVSQSLDNVTIDKGLRTTTHSTNITSNKTFTIKGNDGKNTASKSVSYTFQHKRYYGATTVPASYDSAFILGLKNNEFCTSRAKGQFSYNMGGAGQYFFYCYPASFGDAVFNVGGFDGGISKVATINFTNASGNTTSYVIYKSENANLGVNNVQVK